MANPHVNAVILKILFDEIAEDLYVPMLQLVLKQQNPLLMDPELVPVAVMALDVYVTVIWLPVPDERVLLKIKPFIKN